jgi:hypothetical protein
MYIFVIINIVLFKFHKVILSISFVQQKSIRKFGNITFTYKNKINKICHSISSQNLGYNYDL